MKNKIGLRPPLLVLLLGVTVFAFQTGAQVSTIAATNLTATTATLQATANPGGVATSVFFRWGLTASYGNTTSAISIGSGNSPVLVNLPITGLAAATNYHFQAAAFTATATNYGADIVFSTLVYPFSMTDPALSAGYFQFTFSGTTNGKYTIYGSSNLMDWIPVSLQLTLHTTNAVTLSAATNGLRNFFYQLRSP